MLGTKLPLISQLEGMGEAGGERIKFTAFLGRTRHTVEQSLHEFAKTNIIISAKYEYNHTMQPSSRHAIWVYYKNKEKTDEQYLPVFYRFGCGW